MPVTFEWKWSDVMFGKIKQMKHGDHIYGPDNFGKDEAVTIMIAYYFGVYYIFLIPLRPSWTKRLFEHKISAVKYLQFIMVRSNATYLKSNRIEINGRFGYDETCWKVHDKAWIDNAEKLQIAFYGYDK